MDWRDRLVPMVFVRNLFRSDDVRVGFWMSQQQLCGVCVCIRVWHVRLVRIIGIMLLHSVGTQFVLLAVRLAKNSSALLKPRSRSFSPQCSADNAPHFRAHGYQQKVEHAQVHQIPAEQLHYMLEGASALIRSHAIRMCVCVCIVLWRFWRATQSRRVINAIGGDCRTRQRTGVTHTRTHESKVQIPPT